MPNLYLSHLTFYELKLKPWLFLGVIGILSFLNANAQCPAPTGLNVSAVTNSSAKIAWTGVTGVASPTYSWWVTNNGGTQIPASGTAATPLATASNLLASTNYKVYVQTNCTSPVGTSATIGPISFTTGCAPVGLPFMENLSSVTPPNLPACWSSANLLGSGLSWATDNVSGNKAFTISKYAMNDWLWTGAVTLEAGIPYEISFTYKGNSANVGNLGLFWGTAPTASAMNATALTTIAISNQAPTSKVTTFTPTTTGIYYMGWLATRQSNASVLTINLDDISIRPKGCIATPTVNPITTLGVGTATASWTNITGTSGYEWRIVLAGAGASASAIATGNLSSGVTTVTATGLPSGVAYDFYLRGKCGTANFSNWSSPQSFTLTPQATLTASTTNDAFIQVNWTLPVDPCLLSAGQAYAQGVHLSLSDAATNQVLTSVSVPNLAQYLGAQQPVFNAVIDGANGSNYTLSSSINNGNQIPYWTLESWLKHNNGLNNAILFQQQGASPVSIQFLNAQQLLVVISGTTYTFPVGNPAAIPAGKWTHIALANSGNSIKLYVDGLYKSEVNITLGSAKLNVNNPQYKLIDNYANGQVGELRLWNRVRSATEIQNDRFLTTFSTIAQNNLLLWTKWTAISGASSLTDMATIADGAASSSSTMATVAYTSTPDYTPIVGSFQHFVGPSKTKNYKLNVNQIGSGAATTACNLLTATGSTIAYQAPIQVTATDNGLNEVTLSWKNKSKLSETIKIYRAGKLRAVVAGTTQIDSVLTFKDTYTVGDTNSIKSGLSYNYCIETYSNTLQYTSPSQVCDMGGTLPLNFVATDNAFPDKVNLSWNNLGSFGYNIQIQRNGQTLVNLPATTTSYTDLNPIYGKNSTYTLVLQNTSSATILETSDLGGVAARGSISGRVVSNVGNYAIRGAKVALHSLVDTSFRATAITDINGNYAFSGLYYDITGNFTLTASYANHTFYDNPKTVNLYDLHYQEVNLIFKDSTGFTVSNTALNITNLMGTLQPNQNAVNLTWNYTSVANDTTVFDLYRETQLIGTLTNIANGLSANYAFQDLTGMPNANYIYKLVGYRIQGATVYTKTAKDTLIFPVVAPATSITATANSTLGTINLSWLSSISNYNGFNLYRNGTLVADLASATSTYTDDAATPGITTNYILKAKRTVGTVTYESTGVNATIATPALPAIATLNATASTTRQSVTLSWTVPTTLQAITYNFDGYRVYRGTLLMGILPKGITNYTFEDKTGIPSTSYTYSVRTFAILTDSTYAESSSLTKTISFPAVSAVTGLVVTSSLPGEIRLKWTPVLATATNRNVDGQLIITKLGTVTDTLAFLNPRVSSYRYFTNNTASRSFFVRTYRIVNGIKYYSTSVLALGSASAGSNTPQLPTNFKASTDLANQIRLSWDYPSYIFSTFNIYRDSILLTSLPTEVRSFQDTSASEWQNHFYQIEAINGGNTAQRVGTLGQARSQNILTGRVYSQSGQYGMPGVDIYVTATEFFARAKTDSTGYYQLEIPARPGNVISVMADAYNIALTQSISPYVAASLASVQTITTTALDKAYTVNFSSSFAPVPVNLLTPAKPSYVIARADESQYRVGITWRLKNNDFDGVEVYRANQLLATVLKNAPFMVWDELGAPGISYIYQVRSYKMVGNDKVYSAFVTSEVTFPKLYSPIYLTSQTLANGLRIEWSHKWDNHTSYIIERNDETVATVKTGAALIYEDYNGLPNQQYVYKIRAMRQLGNSQYYSDAAQVALNFPDIKEVSNVSVTTPNQTVTGLVWASSCGNNTTRSLNHTLLSWTYPSNNADGYLVYRNNTIIATLPKDSMLYRDYAGIPDVLYTYKVQAIKKIDNISYNSLGVTTSSLIYPSIAPVYNIATKDTLGMIRLTWSYPEKGVNGFLVRMKVPPGNWVDEDTISYEEGQNATFTYWHKDGLPGESYAYQIQAYSIREGITYNSSNSECSALWNVYGQINGTYDWTFVLYPKPVPPSMVVATDGIYESYVKVSWNYSTISELSGFEIYRDNALIGETDKGAREWNHLIFSTAGNYTLRAFREINANRFYSDYSAGDNGYSAPLQNIINGSANSFFGTSTDAYENSILVGAPAYNTPTGAIHLYKLDANAKIQSVFSVVDNSIGTVANYGNGNGFGYDVGLTSDMVVAIRPWSNSTDKCYVAKLPTPTAAPTYENYFAPSQANGAAPISVAISDMPISTNSFGITNTHSIMYGFPGFNGGNGGAYIDVYGNNAKWDNSSVPNGAYGQEIATNQRHVVISRPDDQASSTPAFLHEFYLNNPSDGTSWNYIGALPYPNGMPNTAHLGYAMAYSSDYDLAVGAPDDNGGGKVYVYHRNDNTGNNISNSTWSAPVAVPNPTNLAGERFGRSVDIAGNWLLVSAPDANAGAGKAYLYYKNTSNQWILKRTYPFGGRTVSLGSHHAFIGAGTANSNNGVLYIEPLSDADSVTATQGTISGQTRIDWKFKGVDAEIGGFRIYREGTLIGTANKTDRLFFDDNGIQGKKYIYEVAVYHSDMEQRRYPAEGWSKANGLLEGAVTTLDGEGKIAGVTITATALIDNNYYNYQTVTNSNGVFQIPEVYYGSGTANYTLTASFKDHQFKDNPIPAQLSSTQSIRSELNFLDKTAYTINGHVAHRYATCGLDSMAVTGYYVFNDGSKDTLSTVYTNKMGDYSITIDPYKDNLSSILVSISNSKTINKGGLSKTLSYMFAPQSATTFPISPSFTTKNNLDFLDTLTYPVTLSLQNACAAPIIGGKYQLRVKDEVGCYNQTFVTNTNGFVVANIPPINAIINVEGVDNLNQQTEPVVNYLRSRPQSLNLYDLHRDTLSSFTLAQQDSATKRAFTYFVPPTISVLQGFNRYLCNDPQKPAIVATGKSYTLKFGAQSNYNGTSCNNKTGKLVIRNEAAVEKETTVVYSDALNAFSDYTFEAGLPNLVDPYTYTLSIEYRSTEGELLALKTLAVLVEGATALPGSDIIVDLSSAEQNKLPLYVLRKPPGDNSSASIEAGTSVTYEFSESRNWGGGAGFLTESAFAIGSLGLKLAVESLVGRDNNSSYLAGVTVTNTTGISTTGDDGKNSDVIVGTGVAAQYGLAQSIKVNTDGCTIGKTTSLQFTPNSLQTTWMYSTGHIQHLIEGYEAQVKEVDAGTLVIKGKEGTALTKDAAKMQLQGYINAWKGVINYHKKESLPWYDLCAHPITENSTARKSEIQNWRNKYCLDTRYVKGGSYDKDGNFTIADNVFEELPWTNDRIWAYNVARTAVYHLEHVYPGKDGTYTGFIGSSTSGTEYPWFLDNWRYNNKALENNSAEGKAILDKSTEVGILSGTPAKNITFDAGVEYSESYENNHATSNSYDAQFFIEVDVKLGVFFKTVVDVGFGVSIEATDLEKWIGAMANFHYNYTAARSETSEKVNTTSFTLADDDEFDQFSVTCIQGVNPNHTPYFALLGGRSSCPYEEGTIARDNPKLFIYDEASNSVSKEQTQYNVNPSDPAKFWLQITNANPFNEPREITLYQILESNTEGAEVRVSGQELGNGLDYYLTPNEPIKLLLTLGKGAQDYDIKGLKIGVKASCDEMKDVVENKEVVTLNAYFDSPCSGITLLTPESDWQIKRRNPFVSTSREQLLIKMADYDTDNALLKSIRVEYRRIGAGQEWTTLSGSEVTKDSLAKWNSLNFLPGTLKYYSFIWDITDNYTDFPDGEYDIRAVAECAASGSMKSAVMRGSIYRNTTILGLPEPADQLWTNGDEISVAYIHDIDCNKGGASFVVRDSAKHVWVNGKVTCHNNKISFLPTDNMKGFDGDSLYMKVKKVPDMQGNTMDSVLWAFKVVAKDLYVADEWINVVVAQGSKTTITTSLINNTAGGEPLSYTIQGLTPYSSWLSTSNATGSVLNGMPELVTFEINAATMPIDTVEAMLNVQANGYTYTNALKIRVRVLPKAPNWQVNPNAFEQTMTVVGNFNFNNLGVLSTDSADMISVWIDNQVRGVANISKVTSTIYNAIISVYANSADASKPLAFRVWDASAGIEYDARPAATLTYGANKIVGTLANPVLLNINTTTDKARYIPLNKGWTMFSVNSQSWNAPINTALASLKYKQTGDIIKTANKSASYSSNAWVSANGLDSANVHRGYSIYLQNADTLRVTGAAATIKPITLNAGWNFIGYPLQTPKTIDSAMLFLGTPDTMWLKTVAQNPAYSKNMVANYYGGSWKYAFNSDMQKLRPNFAYWLKVNTTGSQLKYPGVTNATPVSLLRVANSGANADPEDAATWGVNPARYEHNMLINATIAINKQAEQDTSSLVAAFVGNECRGIGKLTYLPELKKSLVSMFVYSNEQSEEMEYRIYSGTKRQIYRHYEPISFEIDAIKGSFEQGYKFSNVAPDNTFFVSAYPNPFETKFKVEIQTEKAQTFTLRLVDIAGHNLMEQNIEDEITETTIQVNTQTLELSSGVYFLQVIGSLGETSTIKLVK